MDAGPESQGDDGEAAVGDPALIAGWIRETSTIRATAAAALRVSAAPPHRLNEDQIAAIVDGLGSLLDVLREADPRDKAELYSRIGLRMIYKPGPKTLKAEIVSSDLGRVLNVCPEIDTNQYPISVDPRDQPLLNLTPTRPRCTPPAEWQAKQRNDSRWDTTPNTVPHRTKSLLIRLTNHRVPARVVVELSTGAALKFLPEV